MQSGAPHSGVGRVIADRYLLLNRLGSGGMGHVWLAHDRQLDCEVALKEIVFRHPGEAEQERAARVARARAEARHAAGLRDHPNVVTVHDVLEHDALPWIVMEYVPGALDLKALVALRGALAPAECARIGLAVLDALTAGHERGVMHRDVKPANILLAPDRTGSPYARVLLTDYGISVQPDTQETRYTRTHVLVGTAGYLAPERAQGGPPTAASDLFSLGCTLYHAVEGYGPFDRDSDIAALTAVVLEEPRPMLRAGALEPVLAALLTKVPVRRITATEAEAALSAIVMPQAHPRTAPDLGSQPQWASEPTHTAEPGQPLAAPVAHETPWYVPSGGTAGRGGPGGGNAQGGEVDWSPAEHRAAGADGDGFAPPPPFTGAGPAPGSGGHRRRHRSRALLAGMATTLGLALVVGGTWYAMGNMRELTEGLGGQGTGSAVLPYGGTVGLTELLKDGDCVDVTWTGTPFTDAARLRIVPGCAGPAMDGQVMASYEASSAEDARAGGAAQCEQLTMEARDKLVDVRAHAVLPTGDGFDAAGHRVACLVLGERRPVHGPIGEYRTVGETVIDDVATLQKQDCLDRISGNELRLVSCQDRHREKVLGFHEMSPGTTYEEAQRQALAACEKNLPPKQYGHEPGRTGSGFWVSEDGWKKGAHFVVCTVISASGGTMEGEEA
ncbi:protein kinase [Streptomyces sp. DSM 3412]|uniref:non-specific serine/threonine protein kinase n=1 Tax=Streptomyces gottesmaniae TaxID=3075518 RepID=A0ABU2Z4K1_9ACTN|nr:serine/threonine-protein kinase [Streptomyces sp. DSM 3412]MDT0571366.1 protein kinase [Streptomyces sp. DSM 3412]